MMRLPGRGGAIGTEGLMATSTQGTCDIGLVGLAVMGQNLALNMADHGFKVAVYNRTTKTMTDFVAAHPKGSFGAKGGGLFGEAELADFVDAIKRPRKIMIMVKAGDATDAVINGLVRSEERRVGKEWRSR